MQNHYEQIRRLGGEVLVVTFSPPERIADYVAAHGWPFPVVADPERAAYRAFDLREGSWWSVSGPRVIRRYLSLMVRGRMPKKPAKGDDVWQLGGDFVLDAQRRLVYVLRSHDSADRPPAEDLVQAMRQAGR